MAEAPGPHASAPKAITLTYRTDSGRLNQWAAGRPAPRPLSGEQPHWPPVPQFTTSTLIIEHPHPDGIEGFARVTATFRSPSDDDGSSTLWSTIVGEASDAHATRPHFSEVWQTEIRDWQLASLLAELKEKDFFRRVKVVGCDAHIATDINGSRMFKDFPAMAELDNLLITIRRNGRMSGSPDAQSASPLTLLE